MTEKRQTEEKHFVEEVGLVFEQTGLPRMAGRIFGWLLISEPPHQSMDQFVKALMASKGSISTMTRLLIQLGLIERLSLPGIRHDYFRLRPHAWQYIVKRGLEDEIKMFHHLTEHGLRLTADKALLTRQWIEEMHDVYTFLGREFPTLIARWERENKRGELSVR